MEKLKFSKSQISKHSIKDIFIRYNIELSFLQAVKIIMKLLTKEKELMRNLIKTKKTEIPIQN